MLFCIYEEKDIRPNAYSVELSDEFLCTLHSTVSVLSSMRTYCSLSLQPPAMISSRFKDSGLFLSFKYEGVMEEFVNAVTIWFADNPSGELRIEDVCEGENADGANSLPLWKFLRRTLAAIMAIKEQKGFDWISGMKEELDLEDVELGAEVVDDA